jgi:hypothetical protein
MVVDPDPHSECEKQIRIRIRIQNVKCGFIKGAKKCGFNADPET